MVIVPRGRFVSFSLFLCLTLSDCFIHGVFRRFLPSDVERFVAVLCEATGLALGDDGVDDTRGGFDGLFSSRFRYLPRAVGRIATTFVFI